MSSINNASAAHLDPGFVLWYLLIMLCCVVPTCCAYSTRFGGIRYSRDSRDEQSEVNNDIILAIIRNREDSWRRQRKKQTDHLTALLRSCTVLIKEKDIFYSADANGTEAIDCEESGLAPIQSLDDVESGGFVQLPIRNSNNGTCRVPAACAICLSPYKEDEQIMWSPTHECCHAYHTKCIIPWLVKEQAMCADASLNTQLLENTRCPCCRQPFYSSKNVDAESGGQAQTGILDPPKGNDVDHLETVLMETTSSTTVNSNPITSVSNAIIAPSISQIRAPTPPPILSTGGPHQSDSISPDEQLWNNAVERESKPSESEEI